MTAAREAQSTKLKGYILGLSFTTVAGILLGWAAPLLELAGQSGNVFSSSLLYVAILLQLVGGILNFFALSYLRPAIVFPIYGSIQIFESVIVAQILLPATNPWSNLFYASLILIIVALLLIAYSISKKPEEEVVDLLPPNPQLETPNKDINEGFAEVFKLLDLNLMGAYGRIRHRWAHSGGKYTHPTIMESCYSSLVWKLWMPEIAIEILEPFLDAQAEDGLLPNKVKMLGRSYKPQPPLLAHCLLSQNPSVSNLKEIYPKLKRFYEWYLQNRRNSAGLFFWKTPEESGMPETPRFEGKNSIDHIMPVDLNVYMVLETKALTSIASQLGLEEDQKKFEMYGDEISKTIMEKLWDQDSNKFYDWDSNSGEFIKIESLTNFMPLIAKILPDDQLEPLLAHLSGSQSFNTPIPFPSISVSDKHFDASKWRGAVSICLAYMILKGIEAYQKDELLSNLALKLVQGIFEEWRATGTFAEYFSPDSSKFPSTKKPGKDFVGSTGLINTILVEEILGIHLNSNLINFYPRIPKKWQNNPISYRIPTKSIEIIMFLNESNEIKGEITKGTQKIPFYLNNYSEKTIRL